jgi:hypothetical protein
VNCIQLTQDMSHYEDGNSFRVPQMEAIFLSLDFFVAVTVQIVVFWIVAWCSLVCGHRHFGDLMIIIFWEMTPCGSYKNRRFGGSYSSSRRLYKSLLFRSVPARTRLP